MPILKPIRRILPALFGLSVIIIVASAGCVVDVEGRQVSETDEQVFEVTGTPDIDLSTFDGPIEILGWDRQDVRIEIEKRGADDRELMTSRSSWSRTATGFAYPCGGPGGRGV